MSKATYLLISWNHGNIMLKAMQKEPSWSCVLHFIRYFSHFSFTAISQACFHVRWKFVSLHNYSISQALFNLQEKFNGNIFKQLWNNSFIYGVCMLLKHVIMLWSQCKLVSYFVFKCGIFSNKRDWNIATESEVF